MVLIKKIIVLLIVTFSTNIFILNKAKISATENKVYCNATIDDYFSDNKVILVLTKEASREDKIYSADDFKEFGCISVEDVSSEATSVFFHNKTNNLVNIENYKRILCLEFREKSKENILDVINELINKEYAYYAGPDYFIKGLSINSNDTFRFNQWAINDLQLNKVWDFATGSSVIKVGVLDSGIDGNHPELSSILDRNLSCNFLDGKQEIEHNPTDVNGHGTHVAGIIGAIGNNNQGVTGVNWNVSLVSLKVLDSSNEGKLSDIYRAINYAQSNGIKILNCSIGIYRINNNINDYDLNEFISAVENYTGLIICGAGNSNSNIDNQSNYYPSVLNDLNIITVGAYNESGEKCDFSNYGQNTVDIYAPGENILSTFPMHVCMNNTFITNDVYLCEITGEIRDELIQKVENGQLSWPDIRENFEDLYRFPLEEYVSSEHFNNGYHYMSGTSMATPFVAGVAALLLSCNPNLTSLELRSYILNSCETMTISLSDNTEQTVKKLNPLNAVKLIINDYGENFNLYYGETERSILIDTTSFNPLDRAAILSVFEHENYDYTYTISSQYPINVKVYNADLEFMDMDLLYSDNNCKVIINSNLLFGSIYFKINFIYATYGNINIKISGPNHTHEYYNWLYLNNISHIEVCECGQTGTITKPHAIRQNELGNLFSTCIDCGARIPIRDGIIQTPGINNIMKFSINGSYILPNGIIILVEEDIYAYLNGILVFYYKDLVLEKG